jgi:hypothetical protein
VSEKSGDGLSTSFRGRKPGIGQGRRFLADTGQCLGGRHEEITLFQGEFPGQKGKKPDLPAQERVSYLKTIMTWNWERKRRKPETRGALSSLRYHSVSETFPNLNFRRCFA